MSSFRRSKQFCCISSIWSFSNRLSLCGGIGLRCLEVAAQRRELASPAMKFLGICHRTCVGQRREVVQLMSFRIDRLRSSIAIIVNRASISGDIMVVLDIIVRLYSVTRLEK